MKPHAFKAWLRPLIWLVVSAQLAVELEASTVVILLLFSMLVLIPLARPATSRKEAREELGAALLAGVSFNLEASGGAGLMVVGWLTITWRRAVKSLSSWQTAGSRDAGSLCLAAADVFPAVGAAWLMAHRANWTPWGFDPLIVLLTAAHFHHAGFTLPLMAGLNDRAGPGRWTRCSCVAILLGVPLVAAGITCTHFGVMKVVEPVGVAVLVLGALGVAVSQMRRGLESQRPMVARMGFVISGASLFVAMLLALSFGLQYWIPHYALTMPQMWAIHGTLNAFGFGLCGILAWRGAQSQGQPAKPCCA